MRIVFLVFAVLVAAVAANAQTESPPVVKQSFKTKVKHTFLKPKVVTHSADKPLPGNDVDAWYEPVRQTGTLDVRKRIQALPVRNKDTRPEAPKLVPVS